MKKSLNAKIILSTILTWLIFTPLNANAQVSVSQTGTLAILPGAVTILAPDNFLLPVSFAPPATQTVNINQTLLPEVPESTLRLNDAEKLSALTVTISTTSFISTTNPLDEIPLSNFGVVTLSESLTETVDGNATNDPPGAPNLNAPLDCNWDPLNLSFPTMESFCSGSFTNFTPVCTPGTCPANSDELTIIENSSVEDFGIYSIGFGFDLLVDDTVIPGSYEATITFTLILS